MCLIIQAKNPQVITDNMMNCAYSNNDDGFGLMFHNKGKVHIHKIGKPKSFKTIQKVWDSYKNLDTPIGLHFRFNTNGTSSKSMSHPFQILSTQENGRDLWVMHNGPQLPTPMIDDNKSDTHQFIKWVLKPQLVNEPELLYNNDWQEMLADTIGSDKLLFLDSKTEEFTIINEQEGKQTDDMWLSNTYSLQPSGAYAMSRDYEYDFDKDEVKKKLPLPYGINNWNVWTNEDDEYGYSGVSNQTVTIPGNNNQSWKQQKFWDKSNTTIHNPHDYGASVCEKDLMGATAQEILEIVEENPQGVAQYLHDLVYDDDACIALNQMKEGN
jgi:predicted glutamine amidotransferase